MHTPSRLSAGDLEWGCKPMSDLQTLASGAGAGFLTSVMTLLFTIFGFHKRLERIETEKLNREIHELCSTGILAQVTELRRCMSDEVRGLGAEIKQLRVDTNRDIRELAHRIDLLASFRKNQMAETNRDIRELTNRIDRFTNQGEEE